VNFYSVSSRTSVWFLFVAIVVGSFSSSARAQSASAAGQSTHSSQYTDAASLRRSFSPAEKKMSFDLVLLSRKAHNAPLGSFAALVDTSEIDANGYVTVDITAFLSPSLMASPVMADIIRDNGAISVEDYTTDHLHARLHQKQLIDLAANPNVWAIRSPSAGPASSTSHIVAISASSTPAL
jgi:hypothetical protein